MEKTEITCSLSRWMLYSLRQQTEIGMSSRDPPDGGRARYAVQLPDAVYFLP